MEKKATVGNKGYLGEMQILVLREFQERWLVGAGEDRKGRGYGGTGEGSQAWQQCEGPRQAEAAPLLSGCPRDMSWRLTHSLRPAHSSEKDRVSLAQTRTIFGSYVVWRAGQK